MTIKEKIQKILKYKGMSAVQMEKDLGFAKGYISKLDKASPSSENIVKIAEYLNVTTDSLLVDDQPKSAPMDLLVKIMTTEVDGSFDPSLIIDMAHKASDLWQRYQKSSPEIGRAHV